jgi:hypothetical protein
MRKHFSQFFPCNFAGSRQGQPIEDFNASAKLAIIRHISFYQDDKFLFRCL